MFETETPIVPVTPIVNPNPIPLNTKQTMSKPKSKKILIISALVVVALGITTGYFVSGKGSTNSSSTSKGGVVNNNDIQAGAEFGGKDSASFTDQALGVIEAGGIDGEGTHKLLREGGSSQTVYLTSSTLDLEQFTGRKVQIWGKTFKAQKAGWLMDVGRLKVLE